MDNYIMFEGEKIELPQELAAKLKTEKIASESPFDRISQQTYFYIDTSSGFSVQPAIDDNEGINNIHYRTKNYCHNKNLMTQYAHRMELNLKLWHYSMTHDGNKIDWDSTHYKYYICYNWVANDYCVDYRTILQELGVIYFISEEVAKTAIKEVIRPFLAEHPDFDWKGM